MSSDLAPQWQAMLTLPGHSSATVSAHWVSLLDNTLTPGLLIKGELDAVLPHVCMYNVCMYVHHCKLICASCCLHFGTQFIKLAVSRTEC